MKFSHSLLKKLLPKLPSGQKTAEILSRHSFEVESVKGDTLEIKLPANRYSDASSHAGIARELAAALGLNFRDPVKNIINAPSGKGLFGVRVEDRGLCRRYSGRLFKLKKVWTSPPWLKKILKSCGIQSINGVVDIMNYAMLVTGQPMHAFDADMVEGKIIVREAKKGEKITTLDAKRIELPARTLLISDEKKLLAIAGIKGGKEAGVIAKTGRIIVEAANFDPTSIFKTSREIKLQTDASLRFAHDLSPALVQDGMDFATALLAAAGADLLDGVDIYPKKAADKLIAFDVASYEKLTGERTDIKEAKKYFEALGFEFSGKKVRVPAWRADVSEFEDLAEELTRFLGYDRLASVPPNVAIRPVADDLEFSFSSRVKEFLSRAGLDEVYNSSFYGEKEVAESKESFFGSDSPAVELENPIAENRKYLRRNLTPLLMKNAEWNSRFFQKIRIFELGKTFAYVGGSVSEKLVLGIMAAGRKDKDGVLELKGHLSELLRSFGATDFFFERAGGGLLKLMVDGADIGFIRQFSSVPGAKQWVAASAELDAGALSRMVSEEHEYKPLPKYPEVARDISVIIDRSLGIGDIVEEISLANEKLIEDVDLADEYWDEKFGPKQSLTFRIVFRSDERTLGDEEVNAEMAKIAERLERKFGAEIR